MSSRHTRRKAAKAAAQAKLERLAAAQRSATIGAIVKANKSAPVERNYYPESPMGRLGEHAPRGLVSAGMTYSRLGRIENRGGQRKFVPAR